MRTSSTKGTGPVVFARKPGNSICPRHGPRFLDTCWVFTLWVVWKRSAIWSTTQSWVFFTPEWALQVQWWWSPSPSLISTMRTDLPHPTHRLIPKDTFGDILFLRLKVCHLCPEDRVLNSSDNALLRTQVKMFSATRDHKVLLELCKDLSHVVDLVCLKVKDERSTHLVTSWLRER